MLHVKGDTRLEHSSSGSDKILKVNQDGEVRWARPFMLEIIGTTLPVTGLNISEINSEEELIEKIKNVKTDKKRNYKIILEGYKNIEIDLNKIQKMVLNENILKVKDFSKVKYDIKELA